MCQLPQNAQGMWMANPNAYTICEAVLLVYILERLSRHTSLFRSPCSECQIQLSNAVMDLLRSGFMVFCFTPARSMCIRTRKRNLVMPY